MTARSIERTPRFKSVYPNLVLVVLANQKLVRDGEEENIRMEHVVFAARAYEVTTAIWARRKKPGAVLHDPKAIADRW